MVTKFGNYLKYLVLLQILLFCFSNQTIVFAQHKIVILKSKNLEQFNIAIESFKKGLKGEQTPAQIVEYDISEGNQKITERIKQFAPDLIVPVGSTATKFAQEKFQNIPIVFTMVLYSSLASSMGLSAMNITGVSMDISILKQFESIKDVIPSCKKIGVLYNPNETGNIVEEAKQVAQTLGMELVAIKINSSKDVPNALENIERRVDVLWAIADITVFTSRIPELIITYSLQHNLPIMGFSSTFVEAGALFGLSQDFADIGKQSAEIAKLVLSGAKPREIRIAVPRKVSLILNLRIAKEIGIKVPDKIIEKASKVIR